MKPVYTILIALGTGVVGFLAGGGLGLVQGGMGGTVLGVALGTASGMCIPVEAALEEQALTLAQMEQLAVTIGQNLRESDPEIAQSITRIRENNEDLRVEVNSEQCTRFLSRVAQAMK